MSRIRRQCFRLRNGLRRGPQGVEHTQSRDLIAGPGPPSITIGAGNRAANEAASQAPFNPDANGPEVLGLCSLAVHAGEACHPARRSERLCLI